MLKALFSKPYSRLYIVGDNADWVIDEESKELKKIAGKLGLKAEKIMSAHFDLPQFVHYASQFSLNEPSIYKRRNRISVDYFHGKPEQGESFKKCFESLKANHEKLFKIRVSNREMEKLVKESGIAPAKVARIPIGINLGIFTPQTEERKRGMREELAIPQEALVIGSFQKDGVGWGEGDEPKLIKGPDIFLSVIERLKEKYPHLFVLLTGPARGYVKKGLKKLGVPYRHDTLGAYSEVARYYDALDLYLITSREEGGPKACLEAMAKGVPLVTTGVGQCRDLVSHGQNAMMAPIDDVGSLCHAVCELVEGYALRQRLKEQGFKTASENSYEAQLPLWKKFFEL